jgi:O-antigen ligase
MRLRLVSLLFVVAVVTLDFSPVAVYRYLLVSDVLLLIALALQWNLSRAPAIYFPRSVQAAFALYVASTALAFARPAHPATGAFTWVHSVFLMLIYVPAATTLMTLRPDLQRWVRPAVLFSASVQGLVVAQAVSGGLNWTTGTRIAGAFGSIQLWIYAAAVVAALSMLMAGTPRQRVFALVSLVPIGAAEIFLRSRMLWIASFLGACFFGFLQARRKPLAVASAFVVALALVVGYLAELYPPAVQARIGDALRPSQASDLVARLDVVQAAVGAIAESPFIGVGIGQSPDYFEQLPVPPVVVNAHNLILHASMEGGLLAGAALCLLPIGIFALWLDGRRRVTGDDRVSLNWAFATLAAVYAAAQLTPSLFEHTFFFLVAFLAAVAAGRRAVPPASRPFEQAA